MGVGDINLIAKIAPYNDGFRGMVEDDQIVDTATTAGNILISDGSYFASSAPSSIEGSLDHGALNGLSDDDHTQYLLANGTRALTANWDAGSFEIRAQTFESDVITGTAPFTIASTTVNTNLNADMLDGKHVGTSGNTVPLLDGSNTWSSPTIFTNTVNITDNVNLDFGTGLDAYIEFYTAGTPDFLYLGLRVNSNDYSGYFIIGEYDDVANRIPSGVVANPTLRICSSDQTSATDYIDIYHNQTDGYITCGTGTINFDNENLTTTGDVTIGANLISAGTVNLKVSGNSNAYLQFETIGYVPYINAIGTYGYGAIWTTDDATYVGNVFRDDASHYLDIYFHKTSHYAAIFSKDSLRILTNNEEDNYLDFSTTSGNPKINCVGGGIFYITASGGIDFGSTTLITTGTLGAGAITGASLKANGTLSILEGGGTPTKYTIFQGGDQAIDLTYTLPVAYPAVSGYVLSSTDAGVMSWVAGGAGGGYTNLTEFVDQTAWRLFYSNADGDVTELALGTDGKVLTSTGASTAPDFEDPPVTSVTATNTTLTISPTTGAVSAGINLATANTWTGAITMGTTTKINFTDTNAFINASSSGTLVVQGATQTQIGVVGDIILGDSTLRTMYPQTAAKIDLGSATYPFNDVWCANITITEAKNVVLGTTTGTKIGTSTSQKLGFYNVTPVVQPAGTTDVLASLVTLGLRAASSNPPLNIGTGAVTCGKIVLGAPTELTIASGVVTVTGSYHKIDTEGDAATDSLVTINGGSAGQLLFLECVNGSRAVTIVDGGGNIQLNGTLNFTMDNPVDKMCLIYNGSTWNEYPGSNAT